MGTKIPLDYYILLDVHEHVLRQATLKHVLVFQFIVSYIFFLKRGLLNAEKIIPYAL